MPPRYHHPRTIGCWMACFCPACLQPVPGWIPNPNGRANTLCPCCRALERHRFLAYLIRRMSPLVRTSRAVLDIAPQAQIRQLLVEQVGPRYIGLDLHPRRQITLQGDLCRLPFTDGSFDMVICYHVLEHIADDHAAMGELRRVLRPGGFALVQVPRWTGVATDEDPSAPPKVRIKRFGQKDHVRRYGDDFERRLAGHGLHAQVIQPVMLLDSRERKRMGMRDEETVWVCRPGDPHTQAVAAGPATTAGWKDDVVVRLAGWDAAASPADGLPGTPPAKHTPRFMVQRIQSLLAIRLARRWYRLGRRRVRRLTRHLYPTSNQ